MEAFISYSHHDQAILERLHKHLAQLKRDNLLQAWTDHNILAGETLDVEIDNALAISGLFIALLSPDYIASEYCYEKEFESALKKHQEGTIIIVPVIVEPCEWTNTPFKNFKALPKDGKPISEWENPNTALLFVVQQLRNLILSQKLVKRSNKSKFEENSHRNYQVKKEFDKIQKLEFKERTFDEVREYMIRFIEELKDLENVYTRITDNSKEFNALIVNRNISPIECSLTLTADSKANLMHYNSSSMGINCEINKEGHIDNLLFELEWDEFSLFWIRAGQFGMNMRSQESKKYNPKEIADEIWLMWLEKIGITI